MGDGNDPLVCIKEALCLRIFIGQLAPSVGVIHRDLLRVGDHDDRVLGYGHFRYQAKGEGGHGEGFS